MPSPLRRPDRWDNLPEAVASLPGLYANTMTFSAGPRVRHICHNTHATLKYSKPKPNCQSCIGQRFSLIEMKTFLYILITNFVFSETDEKVVKANVYVYIFCCSY
jgi:hypothetical protein